MAAIVKTNAVPELEARQTPQTMRGARITPLNITIEITTIETIKRFVVMNLGVAFVPLMCVREECERGELAVVPIEGFRHERTLWAVCRRTDAHSQAAQAFMRVIESISEKLLGSQPAAPVRDAGKPVTGAVN